MNARAMLACVATIGALITGAAPRAAAAPPTAEQIENIQAALPAQAANKPDRPRKLLVFTLTKGYRHSSIECGVAALERMGKKTGAFETVVSDDPAVFSPQRLHEFDAICFLNTTGELFEDPSLKSALLDFVRDGKGLAGIHAATDCFYEWPEFGAMIGGYFDGHPWHEHVTLKVEEPTHPLCTMFGGPSFEIVDEIYQLRDPYSRARLRVLTSLDTDKVDMSKQGIHRTDGDFAVSWARKYGKGRVFYCSLGHREEVYWNPTVLQHYLAGIQFALGDVEADATPSDAHAWIELFNGKDLDGWQCKPGSWKVENGELVCVGGSYIWTGRGFGDFELELEFKIPPKGNSGVFFRTANLSDPVQTGIELQVYDTFGKTPPARGDCGAIYDCLAPSVQAARPAGEWNQVRLRCAGPKIDAHLNGRHIIEMDLDQWTEPHQNPDGSENKFGTAYKDMPRSGFIGFQDHGNPVYYRNIRIKPLDERAISNE